MAHIGMIVKSVAVTMMDMEIISCWEGGFNSLDLCDKLKVSVVVLFSMVVHSDFCSAGVRFVAISYSQCTLRSIILYVECFQYLPFYIVSVV